MAQGFCYRVQKDVECSLKKDSLGHTRITCDSTKLCGLVADGCPIAHDVAKVPFPRKKK